MTTKKKTKTTTEDKAHTEDTLREVLTELESFRSAINDDYLFFSTKQDFISAYWSLYWLNASEDDKRESKLRPASLLMHDYLTVTCADLYEKMQGIQIMLSESNDLDMREFDKFETALVAFHAALRSAKIAE